jgi:uncharacterized membrane protein
MRIQKVNKQLLAIIMLGLILRLYRYTAQSIWLDESVSIFLAHQPVKFIVSFIDPTPPLFYLSLHFWTIFGTSEAILKLFTVLLSTLIILGVYLVAKKLYSKKTALYAALITAISPVQVFYAQELRAYALLFLVTTFLVYWYLKFDESAKNKIIYGIFFVATVYTHVYGLFVILAIQIHRLVKNRKDFFSLSNWIKVNAIPAALSIPWLYRIYEMILLNESGWIKLPEIKDLNSVFLISTTGHSGFIFGIILYALAIILVLSALVKQIKKSKVNIEIYWILIPILVPFLLSFVIRPFFFPRYALLVSIPLAILIAYSLDKNRFSKWIMAFFVILSITIVVLQSYSVTKDPWNSIHVKRPVAIIAFYEAFPYIYLNEPECFNQPSIDDVYICAAGKGIFAVQQDYPLENGKNYTFILSKEWLTKDDQLIADQYVSRNATKIAYRTNTDVWIFKNRLPSQPIYVVYPDTN